MTHLLLQADARRIPIASGSVHCVVTSPPYFALRDYGTASWVGGNPECDHVYNHGVQGATGQRADRAFTGQSVYRSTCGKCGAQRIDRQLGLEASPRAYVEAMLEVFAEVHRVMRDDATLWLNIGDSYFGGGYSNHQINGDEWKAAMNGDKRKSRQQDIIRATPGLKPKDMVGIPWMLAFALRDELGFYLRSDIIWHKPNQMPESVTDRPTKSHEYLFLFSKSERYFYDAEAIREADSGQDHRRSVLDGQPSLEPTNGIMAPHKGLRQTEGRNGSGRNRRSVWSIATQPFPGAHFATFPPKLIEPCIRAGSSEKGACPECGAPWERVTEPSEEYARVLAERTASGRRRSDDKESLGLTRGTANPSVTRETRTIGWQPSCSCPEAPPLPCVVHDPFNGSGTTGAVATGLGRSYIGLDLNRDYLELAERRISRPHARIAPANGEDALPLFCLTPTPNAEERL